VIIGGFKNYNICFSIFPLIIIYIKAVATKIKKEAKRGNS
jgi:hypothetical protein